MEIVIKGARWTPEWETLQSMLIQATTAAPGSKLTRIARPDGKCDYRAPGVYNLTFLRYDEHGGSEEVVVKLTVER